MKKKKPELLIPAKGPEEFNTALHYGADAIYVGGETMSLRAGARNFSDDELKAAVTSAHEQNVKVYVTANILAHNGDLKEAEEYFRVLNEVRPDAILIADPGVFSLAKELCPDTDLHISTQANNTNYRTVLFWMKEGAKRVVTARELSLAEIKEIRDHIPDDMEIESFVHGAMCISYSGRCLLSNYFTGRDSNHGECTHPCRWEYAVSEATRPGQYLPIEENERGTFIFNSKDLCMVDHIPDLIDAGIDSLKVEGRMKTALYVAVTARTYRQAIDDYFESPDKYRENLPLYREEIRKCTTRDFCTGFYYGKPDGSSQIYEGSTYFKEYIYLGVVQDTDEQGRAVFCQKNKFCVGDRIEIMKRDLKNTEAEVLSIHTPDRGEAESAPHPKEELHVSFSCQAEKGDIIRMKP
ncbi:MAG: U32 family peptidase [Lachnospiraceae bacterium]|nr:U32 family peptidase [Lachnospiraceae bacterium]